MSHLYPRYSGRLDDAERREFLPFVHELLAVSAAVIRHYFASGAGVDFKDDGSPVTVADRRAEEVMWLLIAARYPDHGLLGEEHGMERPQARYRWVLDPIDGTEAFVSHCFIFGTLVSLVRDGRPILGAISSPLTGHVLVGLGGTQTLLGERPVRVRGCERFEDATVLTTGHRELGERCSPRVAEELASRARLYRTWGDCHGYFQLATGGADVMIDPALQPWDIHALVPVIEGAGGRVTGIDGGDPVQASDLVATAGYLHAEVLEMLKGDSTEFQVGCRA
jgi:myo-inositol-1(or 4)-monophosphatase